MTRDVRRPQPGSETFVTRRSAGRSAPDPPGRRIRRSPCRALTPSAHRRGCRDGRRAAPRARAAQADAAASAAGRRRPRGTVSTGAALLGDGSPALRSPPRTTSSIVRTDQPSSTARLASRSCSARSGVPSSALAWPALSLPSASSRCTSGRQPEQPQRVRHRRAALADSLGDIVVGQLELLDQLQVRGRFLEGGEVLPVEVLDERLLDGADVVGDPHDCRHRRQPGPCAPPATAAPRRSAGTRRRRGARGSAAAARAGRSSRRVRRATPRRNGPAAGWGSA